MALALLEQKEYKHGALRVGGDLRKGTPKRKIIKDGKEIEVMGSNLKHFRFVSPDKELEARFAEVYADQIKEFGGARAIEFAVWADRVDEVFNPCKELRVKSKLLHRCDGKVCELWRKPNGEMSTDPIPCPGGCKYKIKMPIIITALNAPVAINVHSSSFWDAVNLHNHLTAIHKMFGTLMGVRMILRRELMTINKPVMKNGQRTGESVQSTEWLLTVTATEESFQRKLGQMQQDIQRTIASAPQMALAAGAPVNPEEWNDADNDDESDEVHEGVVVSTDAPTVEEKPFDFAKATAAFKKGENILKTQFKVTPNQLHDRLAAKLQGVVPDLGKMTAEELAICIAEMRSWYEELDKAKENK